jgi:hypothetical protein
MRRMEEEIFVADSKGEVKALGMKVNCSYRLGGHDDVFWSMALAIYAAIKAPLPGAGAVMLPH